MQIHDIDSLLKKYSDTEIKHKNNIKSSYDHLKYIYDKNHKKIYEFYFQLSNTIFLSKNARFDAVPTHIHDFIEINYIYSGKCQQTIDNKTLLLNKGQMILIDTKTPHSIGYTGENDIMINFLISRDYLNSSFFSKLTDHNLITTFFINALNDKSANLNYMIFNTSNNQRLQFFIHEFIWEYYHPSQNSKEIQNSLFVLIILDMINSLDTSINYESISESNSIIISALKYMENNFKSCSLESTAQHVGTNPNYLTTILKKYFAKSYKDLIIDLRLEYAKKMLLNSNYTIDHIARECGYQNLNFFYKKFKKRFSCTPKQYRQNNSI